MRLAYVCADWGVPVFGRKGCSVHVQEFIRAAVARGASVSLFASNFSEDTISGLDEIKIHRLPERCGNSRAEKEEASLALNDELSARLEALGPFDLVYERYSLWSFAGMKYARRAGIPGILEVNTPLIQEQLLYRKLMNQTIAEDVARTVFTDASVLIAVSKGVASYLNHNFYVRGKVHIISNGVNPNRFPPHQEPTLPAEPGVYTIGFLGSLKPWHGLSDLIQAFALVHRQDSKTRLLIVGDGPERSNLTTQLQRHDLLEVVKFTGAVPPAEVPGLLASMDVAVAPYSLRSNFYFSPLKVYEYMAAGLPIVASQAGQINEVLEDEVNALLCPPGDVMALATALQRLKENPDLRAKLGKAARANVLPNHTWDSVVKRVLRLAKLDLDKSQIVSAEVAR